MNILKHTVQAWLLAATMAAQAQVLSSPLPGVDPSAPVPGAGPGVHSPDSPFAPIKDRADVLPWSLLTAVQTRLVKNRVLPQFPAAVRALDQKQQRVQGFMMPLEPGERHTHFLLTSVPMTCSFCIPGGPESMIEVRAVKPVKYTLEVVVLEGNFAVLNDDPQGLYYRLTQARAVK